MTRYLAALALLATACGGETRVPEQRCVDWCAQRVLRSYDDGAPLSADVVREWIAYCERDRGPCCEGGGMYYRCNLRWETQP